MENQINLEKEIPLFSDSLNISLDLNPKISTEFQFSSSSILLDDLNPDDFNISFASRKNLFKTNKIKTKFITFKNPISTINAQKEKTEPEMNLSNGRWTKQERIKFAEAIYRFGMDWKKIKEYIATRNTIQLRSHAQKFLYKLKRDKFIVKKGLDFKEMNWQQSLKYLKEKLTEQELLNVLYSIESEMEDNKRMTERYLERKRLRLKKDNLNTNEESLNSSSNSTFDEFNNNSNKNKLYEQINDSLRENNFKNILLPLEENEENHSRNYINKWFDDNKRDIELNNEFIKSNIEENIYDEFSIGQESPIKYKNRLDFIKI